MNSTPYSAPYPPPSSGAFPMPQPGVPQPGMPQPGTLQSETSPPGVSSYEIPVPQSGVPQDGWSSPNTICPLGLECLIVLDSLYVKQKFEMLEAITEWETENKYLVTNANGQPLYYIAEESDSCARMCLGSSRCCEFHVVDINQREVLHMVRPFKFCTQLLLEVYSRGVLLGTITENNTFFGASFCIRNASGKTVLRVKGSWFSGCGTGRFKIKSADDVYRVGEIKKKWRGLTREFLTDADNFRLRFPIDLDVKIKAVLLGACIVIDFLYFKN